ncbi:MAG: CHAT domain-containing protein [Bacteroidota bacterium]
MKNTWLLLLPIIFLIACQAEVENEQSKIEVWTAADRQAVMLLDSAQLLAEGDAYVDAIALLSTCAFDEMQHDSVQAEVAHRLGVYHYIIEQYDTALIAWRTALQHRHQAPQLDTLGLTKTYRNIGYTHFLLENYEAAKDTLALALATYLPYSDRAPKRLADIYKEMGQVSMAVGDFAQAKLQLLTAFDLARPLETWDRGAFFNECFRLFYNTEQYEEALKYVQKSILLYEQMEEFYDEDIQQLANFYNNIGLFHQEQQRDSAIFYYKKAADINAEYPVRAVNLGINYFNLGELYLAEGKMNEAADFINRAIEVEHRLAARLGIAKDFGLKAEWFLAQNKHERALDWNEKALRKLIPELPKDAIPKAEQVFTHRLEIIELLMERAAIFQILSVSGYGQQMNAIYEVVDQLIQQLRRAHTSDETKLFLAQEARRIYEQIVDFQVKQYKLTTQETDLEQAFLYAERSKAVVVLDALTDQQNKQYAGVPFTVLKEERQLKEQIAKTETQLFEQPGSIQIKERLLLLNTELEQFVQRLKQDYPTYAQLKYTPSKLSLPTWQKELDETIISYFISAEKDYAFIVSNDQLELVELGKNEQLGANIQALRQAIYVDFTTATRLNKNADSSYETVAHQLYDYLFQPIVQQTTLPEKIVILPDGILGYLPFESLLTDTLTTPKAYGNFNYLLRQHQISYAYSTALLLEMKRKNHQHRRQQALIVEPEFGVHPEDTLAALSTTADQLNAVLKGKVITKEKATLEQFLGLAENYAILHLSTHGIANDENGDRAFLAFTYLPDGVDNEALYARDLYNLQLRANLVVLSACETSVGELRTGEGIISLARGFNYAGAKSMLTTLWSVNESSTEELLLSFYDHLKAELSKDAALRQAKLDFIAKYGAEAHPFFWSGFIGIGDMTAIF